MDKLNVTKADLRSALVVLALLGLVLFKDVDPGVVVTYLLGLAESNPLDREG